MIALTGLSALACVFTANDAHATDPEAGLAIDRLERPSVGSRFYASDTLELRDPWRPAFGVVSGYTYRAFSIIQADGTRSSLVRNLWTADVAGEIVVPGGMRLGISLPFAVFEDGRDTQIGTSAVNAPPSPAVGDLRISGDVYTYGEHDSPFSLALGVAVYLPSGSRESFMGDSTARVYPRALMTGHTRALVWGVRAGYMLRPHEEFLGGVELGSEVNAGGSIGVQRGPFTFGPEILASTVVSSKAWFTRETTPVETLLSGHFTWQRTFVVGAGAGTRLTDGIGAPVFRGVVSFEYVPEQHGPVKDRDGDGIPDELDHCPDVPGCDSLEPGCPIPAIDTDGDGRPDYQPTCFELPSAEREGDGPWQRGHISPPRVTPLPKPVQPSPTLVPLDPCERVDSPDCGKTTAPPRGDTPSTPSTDSTPSTPSTNQPAPAPVPPSLRTWGGANSP